jgi:ABC-2 type transport system permease protein
MGAVYERELKGYLHGMTGIIFISVNLLFSGLMLFLENLKYQDPKMEALIYYQLMILFLTIPILTMRSIAEDRRQKTDQLLYSLPLSLPKIVLAKYFALLTTAVLPTLVSLLYPLILSLYGTVNFGTSYTALLTQALFIALLCAIGMFISSLTESPAIAAILTLTVNAALFLMSFFTTAIPQTELASLIGFAVIIVLVAFLAYYMTKSVIAAYAVGAVGIVAEIILYFVKKDLFAGAINKVIDAMSVFSRVDLGTSGILDLSGIVYFVTAAALFVFLSVQAVEKRRWS